MEISVMYRNKLERALEVLGDRWVLHSSRYVQRLPEARQPSIHKADVEETFKRVRARMKKEGAVQ